SERLLQPGEAEGVARARGVRVGGDGSEREKGEGPDAEGRKGEHLGGDGGGEQAERPASHRSLASRSARSVRAPSAKCSAAQNDITSTTAAMDQRTAPAPKRGRSRSFRRPTVCGPSPSPIRLMTKSRIAEATARMRTRTSVCVSAKIGPSHMAPNTVPGIPSSSAVRGSGQNSSKPTKGRPARLPNAG